MAAFETPSGLRPARQLEFDLLVKEIRDGGSSLEEAVEEAIQVFEGEFDLSWIYIYRSEEEFQVKEKLDRNLTTIEKTVKGEETPVNCMFTFQGLRQALQAGGAASINSVHLMEGRGIASSLIRLLRVPNEGSEDEEDDDDDADIEEDAIVFNAAVLDVLLLLINEAASGHMVRPERAFLLNEELAGIVCKRLDEDMAEVREFLAAAGIVAILDLTAKMHKKNDALRGQIEALIANM